MAKKKASKNDLGIPIGPVTEVTKSRHIKDSVRCMLWGKAAGRCQFSGCNREVWKSPVTQERVNISEAAHIYAFSNDGARGNAGVDEEKLNDLDNLMLACHDCHKTMDDDKGGVQYSVELLQQWKAEHEKRIELVTGVDPKKSSHVVLYGANIGEHGSPLNHIEAAHAMFPDRYRAESLPIELGITNSPLQDRKQEFWEAESETLASHFDRKVKQRIEVGDIQHLSVFGLAPQPLLVLLGTLLNNIVSADIYHRHREPKQTWDWPNEGPTHELEVRKPEQFDGPPALVIGLTANVIDDRVNDALGIDSACIWTVTTPQPRHDLTRSREDLSNFRVVIRDLLDEIKDRHGLATPLHIFPVAGNSISIELGRARMPKVMMPWSIYDHVNEQGGFVPAINIS